MQTAQQTYETRSASIAAKLEALQALLAKHEDNFDGKNWAMVGDLARIEALLNQALGNEND